MPKAQRAAGPVPVATQVRACRSGVVSSAVAAVLVVTAVLLAAASVPLYALTHQNGLVNGVNVVVAVLFSAVGFVVVRRQPRNAVGWILLTLPAGLQLLPADAASYALLVLPSGPPPAAGRGCAAAGVFLGAGHRAAGACDPAVPRRPAPVAALAPGA